MPDRLTALDATFLNVEHPHAPMHVAGLYLFEGEPEIAGMPGLQGLFQTLEERLPLLPRYRQRVVDVPLRLGQPVWVDDPDFDLSYHLRRAGLPSPGGMRELLDYVARVHARPLDRRRPLWEAYVIEGLADGRLAFYSKVHHAMIDGISGIDLTTVIFDFDPAGRPPPPQRPRAVRPVPGPAALVGEVAAQAARRAQRITGRVLRHPMQVPADVVRGAAGASMVGRLLPLLRPAPEGPLNQPVSAHRRIEVVRVSLARAKAIKNALGGTVNDVILTAVGEALHHFLEHRGEVTEGVAYRVMVPVSVRDESERMALGNRVAAMFVDVPVGPMPPGQRMAHVSHGMSELKERHQAVAAKELVDIASWAPATLHVLAGRLSFSRQRIVNLVVSNVPGVQVPMYAGGARLLETYPLLPLAFNISCNICVSSYDGTLYFGVVADRDAVPDVQVIARGLEMGFDRLELASSPAHSAGRAGRSNGHAASAGHGAAVRTGDGRPAEGAVEPQVTRERGRRSGSSSPARPTRQGSRGAAGGRGRRGQAGAAGEA